MSPIAYQRGVIGRTVSGIRVARAGIAQVLAPGIRDLEADAGRRTHGDLGLHGVVVGRSPVSKQIYGTELRIGHYEILRVSCRPEQPAIVGNALRGIGIGPAAD